MTSARRTTDPAGWTALLCGAFLALCLVGLSIPTKPYFDEIHYLPAARQYLDAAGQYLNPEHPPLGKQLIALGIAWLGETPLGWRIMSALAGTLALFAFGRAMWFATGSRFATLVGSVMLVCAIPLFVHARIAMLDIFMVAFLLTALWQLAAAVREPEHGRWRLAAGGVFIGLCMAAKWNAVPLALLPGVAFLAARALAGRRRLLTSRRGAPVPGITLVEAALWLGLVPLGVYAACYSPAYAMLAQPPQQDLIGLHHQMLALQKSVTQPHPYQSTWLQWLLDTRAIWYLYEPVDGAQRGVLLVGNPVIMWPGLLALIWCAWQGVMRRRWAALAVAILFAVSLGMWIVAAKPIQFYYHYFLPSCFLVAALAMALDALWQSGRRAAALALPLAAIASFAWFYPIVSGAPLAGGDQAFTRWMLLDGWR